MPKPPRQSPSRDVRSSGYAGLVGDIGMLLEQARRTSARAVNSLMTATYWEIGRRIVEFEQGGEKRAVYGDELLERLSKDLTSRYGRGFARPNLTRFRQFYHAFPVSGIRPALSNKSSGVLISIRSTLSNESNREADQQTPSIKSTASATGGRPDISETPSRISRIVSGKPGALSTALADLARASPLPWSHYVLLLAARSEGARAFYQTEALRGGWSVRQLQRQMDSQFYERTALSRDKSAMLAKGAKPQPGDAVSADDEVRHPLVLEFLGLRDEYSETDLEDALIHHLETFLLELGNDFAFVGRQRRLRIDDEWYRVDLLFFHRRLRCLVIIDLKLGRFTHADAGQMHLYLNYAHEHWVQPGENPPVGIVLCSGKSEALVRYATEALPNKLLVREYLTALPDEQVLSGEINRTRRQLEARSGTH